MSSNLIYSNPSPVQFPPTVSDPQASTSQLSERLQSASTERSKASVSLPSNSQELLTDHAPPLMPLRTRDLQALVELFQQDEIEAIEADILHNLLQRYPEPHWDDVIAELFEDSL